MFFYSKRHLKAYAVLEFIALIIFVIGAFLVMQKFLTRSVSGSYKSGADTFGFGRQYSYRETLECDYDTDSGQWFNAACYEENCDCESIKVNCPKFDPDLKCDERRQEQCIVCKQDCVTAACN